MWNKILIFWNKLSIASVIYICLIGILLTFWYGERNNVKQLERLYQQSEAGISAIEAEYLETKYYNSDARTHEFGAKSCEMLAKEILKEFDCVYVSVFEDNENGAEIYTPDHIYN